MNQNEKAMNYLRKLVDRNTTFDDLYKLKKEVNVFLWINDNPRTYEDIMKNLSEIYDDSIAAKIKFIKEGYDLDLIMANQLINHHRNR